MLKMILLIILMLLGWKQSPCAPQILLVDALQLFANAFVPSWVGYVLSIAQLAV